MEKNYGRRRSWLRKWRNKEKKNFLWANERTGIKGCTRGPRGPKQTFLHQTGKRYHWPQTIDGDRMWVEGTRLDQTPEKQFVLQNSSWNLNQENTCCNCVVPYTPPPNSPAAVTRTRIVPGVESIASPVHEKTLWPRERRWGFVMSPTSAVSASQFAYWENMPMYEKLGS